MEKAREQSRRKPRNNGWFRFVFTLRFQFYLFIALLLCATAVDVVFPHEVQLLRVVAGSALLLLVSLSFGYYYEYHIRKQVEGLVRHGPAELKIALTFDDGPSPIYTPMILDVLKQRGVRATFFLVGRHVEKYPDIARRIVQEGHEIGSHSYSHRDLVPASRPAVLREIDRAEQAFIKVVGSKPSLFRPPRGLYSESVRKIVEEKGYQMVLWSISGMDWSGVPAERIARRVVNRIHPGAIILLHDSGALLKSEGGSRLNTVKAVELIIDRLLEMGFEFVTVSELIGERKEEAFDYAPSEELILR